MKKLRKNKTKEKLLSGGVAFGSFLTFDCPDIVELFGIAGFDFVIIDNEHGPGNPHSVQHMLRAAEVRGMDTIIRVPNAEPHSISKSLDIGASGVQVPQVNDIETAKKAVQGVHYFPEGTRGLGAPRALDYGLIDLAGDSVKSNEETLLVCHCETITCFEKLDEIAAVPGIDVIFVGPFDMSQSLGLTGQTHHPKVLQIVEDAVKTIKKHGKVAGVFCGSLDDVSARIKMGYQYIGYAGDNGLFGNYLIKLMKDLNGLRG